jgi:WhiB family redox-sensing transcriptional regulator
MQHYAKTGYGPKWTGSSQPSWRGSRIPRPQVDLRADTANWRSESACREEDPELFFPVGNNPAADAKAAEAKQVCKRCPVRELCLQWAMDTNQDAGVWGGLTEGERRNLKRRINRRATTQTPAQEDLAVAS